MLTNADITILHSEYNAETGLDETTRKIIYGVSWYGVKGTTIGNGGATNRDGYKMRIDQSLLSEYELPADYAASTKENKWTINEGDLVIKGILTEDKTPTEIEKMFEEVMRVTSFADNRRGGLPHLKVVGE